MFYYMILCIPVLTATSVIYRRTFVIPATSSIDKYFEELSNIFKSVVLKTEDGTYTL